MKKILRWLAVLLALAVVLLPAAASPAPTAAAQPPFQTTGLGGGGTPLLYQFAGVRDDGAKCINGKSATTLICTNTGSTTASVLYTVINYDGVNYYSATFNVIAGATYTVSTQLTNLYFEDNVLRPTGSTDNGTGVINQGSGKVYTASPYVICTAQVLDPTGNPPAFVTRLTLHNAYGMIVRKIKSTYLPDLRK